MNPSTQRWKSGAALILVLCGLVLILGLALAFFVSTTGEARTSVAFSEGTRARTLADSTVGYVIGQIRDATCQDRTDLLWTSQPGLIRTFNATGSPDAAYKLYSSSQPRVSGSFDPASDVPPSDWTSRLAEYVDLNAPVTRGQGASGRIFYPILDPRAEGRVEGFSINTTWKIDTNKDGLTDAPMPVEWMYILEDGSIGPASAGTAGNPIIGRVAFWTDDDTSKLNINTASAGSFWDVPRATTAMEVRLGTSLPVQGEFQRLPGHPSSTSLSPVFSFGSQPLLPDPFANGLNASNFRSTSIFGANTAGAQTFYQPFVNFSNLTPRISGNATNSDQSSWGGARRTSAINFADGNSWNAGFSAWPQDGLGNNPSRSPLVPDTDRLYADPDELLFKPDRSPNFPSLTAEELASRQFFLTASSRAPETTVFGTPRISLWPLNSPVGQASNPNLVQDRTVKDRLIAFCSWVGSQTQGTSYSFERQIGSDGFLNASDSGADSATLDVARPRNQALLTYLRALLAAPVPGFGGSFQSKWGGSGGVDKVLAQTFDTVRASINTDYVQQGSTRYQYGAFPSNPRSISVNATSGVLDQQNDQSAPRGYVVPTRIGNALGAGRHVTLAGASLVIMPTEVVNTYDNVTLSNNATWSGTERCLADLPPDFSPALPVGASLPFTAVPTSQSTRKVRAFVLFQPYFPVPGAPSYAPGARLSVRGLNSITVAGTSVGPAVAETRFGSAGGFEQYALANFQLSSPAYFFYFPPLAVPSATNRQRAMVKWPGNVGSPGPLNPTGIFTQALDTIYPFVSEEIDVTGLSSLPISGGSLDVEIQTWKAGDAVQTFTFDFPSSTVSVPRHLTTGSERRDPSLPSGPIWTGLEFGQGRITPTTSPTYPWVTGNLNPGLGVYGDYLSLWRRMRSSDNSGWLSKNLVRSGDAVLSLIPRYDGPLAGDLRLIALTQNVPSTWFTSATGSAAPLTGANQRTQAAFRNDAVIIQTSSLGAAQIGWVTDGSGQARSFRLKEDVSEDARLVSALDFGEQATPLSAPGLSSAGLGGGSSSGDWSSPSGALKDGASFPRPESGLPTGVYGGFWDLGTQAFNFAVVQDSTFEPNRTVSSAGILGGLLSPDATGNFQPWQTLLFSAWPAAGRAFSDSGNGDPIGSHPGSTNGPPDHLFLDNFWMPAVEPYALSEPMSTAGKVNLNFQIAPFTYIERSTALRGVLKPVMVAAVPDAMVTAGLGTAGNRQNYKYGRAFDPAPTPIRYQVDVDATVDEFSKRFANGGVFKSATSVSEVPIVPKDQNGSSIASLDSFWNNHRATADNLREQPYTAMLSRVTTQSNSYTVHMFVQAVKKVPGTAANAFVPGRDQITGEWRGSFQIERYVDVNDPALETEDFASATLRSLGPFYRFRILNSTQFAP